MSDAGGSGCEYSSLPTWKEEFIGDLDGKMCDSGSTLPGVCQVVEVQSQTNYLVVTTTTGTIPK